MKPAPPRRVLALRARIAARLRKPPKVSRSFLAGTVVVSLLGAGVAVSQGMPPSTLPGPASALPPAGPPHLPAGYTPTAAAFLRKATEDLAANPTDPVARGRYLALSGDCIACHTPEGAPPYSGGRGINTPFGVIYSSNLTSDPSIGVGRYTPDTFWRALHEGTGANGQHLYPAFPYTYFTKLSRADSDALLAFLKTVPAVAKTPPANRLPFPLNLRFMLGAWNALYFKPAAWAPQPNQSPEWNRGSYLVDVLGHCGACHSAKTFLGAEQKGGYLQGTVLDNWLAPNLSANPRYGIGAWSQAEVMEFLKTGRNAKAHASGSMGEVVSDSTSLMTDADLNAIAVYLKSIPAAGPAPSGPAPDAKVMKAGEAIYVDACTGCHRSGGVGQPQLFPPLKGHAGVQQPDGLNTVRVILEGARTAPTTAKPTPVSMPSFAWKLNDEQIADVATYVRNSWGNQAPTVAPSQVRKLRETLRPQGPREMR